MREHMGNVTKGFTCFVRGTRGVTYFVMSGCGKMTHKGFHVYNWHTRGYLFRNEWII